MDLQELLEKATPRPWNDEKFRPMPAGDTRVLARGKPISVPYRILSEENFQLARHAANNFEGLLDVAKSALNHCRGAVHLSEANPEEDWQTERDMLAAILDEAIRQAEEVS